MTLALLSHSFVASRASHPLLLLLQASNDTRFLSFPLLANQ
jgi:hypothetical protein